MKGAIVFLAAFMLFLIVTLGYRGLPPGEAIYDAIVGAESNYEVAGISATLLTIAVFNGAVYGILAYLVYWVAERYIFKKEKTTIEIKKT